MGGRLQTLEDTKKESHTKVSEAVVAYLTAVKSVEKRNGKTEDFSVEKLTASIRAACRDGGVSDSNAADRITERVIGRLTRTYDGHTTPTTRDVRETIVASLIDHNLSHVAQKYIAFRAINPDAVVGPRYGRGIRVNRRVSHLGTHPYDELTWEKRDAKITNEKGEIIFEQKGVEVPAFYTQTATNIIVSKYFRGELGTPGRETSVKQMVYRVAHTISDWGRKDGYFEAAEDVDAFEDELTAILVNQMAAFNSPVWFNVGVNPRPQGSACFINSVRDDMRSILNLAVTEGMLFKYGSGTGSNLSSLRSSKENLANSSGKSSGPVSFMKGFDAFAGVIKSGGKTRRAAKMVILNADHPDIKEFIWCKAKEEKKAWTLMDAGYDGSIVGDAYASIFFQNANNSVRVTDEFMRAAVEDRTYTTKAVTTGLPFETLKAREVLHELSDAAWQCGDPGMQYDTTINTWNPVKATGRINASNPCVTGDTLISTSEGYRRIVDLVEEKVDVTNGDGTFSRASRIWKTGHKPVYELRTSSGYTLKLTADHRVKTANRGDVPASELQSGDILELQGVGFGKEQVDEAMAEAVGLAVGDGCVAMNNAMEQEMVTITAGDAEAEVLRRVNEGIYAYKVATAVDGRSLRHNNLRQTQTGVRISTSNHAVVETMKRYAILDRGSEHKQFTDEVFTLDAASQSALLRGLFTADGTVANYREKSQYVSLDSTSLTLLRQVQLLLLGFGVKAKLYQNRRGSARSSCLPDGRGGMRIYPVQQMHSLRISRSSRGRFEETIGFCAGSVKNDTLFQLNQTVDTYADRFTDEFESLTFIGNEDVYDLTEPLTHHFVANGLVVHNCSEYMFLDDTACNLASLNLMKFRTPDGSFDTESFSHASRIVITAMEILVGNSSYPTPAIEQNSHDYRPLGIGYANLGALLMCRGLAYDSEEGRNYAAAITALLSGVTYHQSSVVASRIGPFAVWTPNAQSFLDVIGMHRDAAGRIGSRGVPSDLLDAARASWDEALRSGSEHGYRNAQISVLAPTGTIAFLMDCDTTGIEPDIALVKYKWLVGGGMIKIVNRSVPEALKALEYTESQIREIMEFIEKNDTIEGAPHVKDSHLPVFDCAFKANKGTRSIHYMGHIRMMAATQPFISGAISKTVNLPNEATIEDVMNAYIESWKLGIKAVAIYRDGSKRQQPLTTSLDKDASKKGKAEVAEYVPRRRRLSDERRAITHKFVIGSHEGYITVGLYDDGTPGEIFITMNKEGSVISGLMDAFATSVSVGMQYGVPLKVLVNKFAHMRFEPSGYTNNSQIRIAKSIVDYVFRWMALKFLPTEEAASVGVQLDLAEAVDVAPAPQITIEKQPPVAQATIFEKTKSANDLTMTFNNTADAPACHACGSMMVRNAACYKCLNCGETSGCS